MLDEYREAYEQWSRILSRLEMRSPGFDAVEADKTVRSYLEVLPSQATGEILFLIMNPRQIHVDPAVSKFLILRFVEEIDARIPPRIKKEVRTIFRDQEGRIVDGAGRPNGEDSNPPPYEDLEGGPG